MESNIAIGIDLGTTNSVIGVFKNGGVQIIPNKIGERTTPSVVSILKGKNIVGEETINTSIKNYQNTFYEVKRLIGRKFTDKEFQEQKEKLLYSTSKDKNDNILLEVQEDNQKKFFKPEEVSGLVLKKLKENAEFFLDCSVKKAVITVPAYFNDSQIKATERAACYADLEVLRIIKEPTAAALAYGLDDIIIREDKETEGKFDDTDAPPPLLEENKFEKEADILVFDLGGGTFDVSILSIKKSSDSKDLGEKSFEVKGISGDSCLGGSDFDEILLNYCINDFCMKNNISEEEIRKNKKNCKRLKVKCEASKKILSQRTETSICIDNFYKEKDLFIKITRAKFEELCKELLIKIKTPIDGLLKSSKLKVGDIKEVILIGGTTKMPCIKNLVKKIFPKSTINDRINPDEAVAYGATLQAIKLIEKSQQKFILLDVIPFSIGFSKNTDISYEKSIDQNEEIINIAQKYSKIPFEKKINFSSIVDNQSFISLKVFEGDVKYTKDDNNNFLGEFLLENIPSNGKGQIKKEITFKIDENGVLSVECDQKPLKCVNGGSTKKEDNNNDNKLNIESQVEIQPIRQVKDHIALFRKSIKETNTEMNNEKRYKILNNYKSALVDLIQEYEKFEDDISSEKIYFASLELFHVFRLMFKTKNPLSSDDLNDIKKKIKSTLERFIKNTGYCENIILMLEDYKKYFSEYAFLYIDMFYTKGKQYFDSKVPFSRYYSKMYLESALRIADKINVQNLNTELKKKFNEITKDSTDLLGKISSFSHAIQNQIAKKEFLIGSGTGFTLIHNLLNLGNIRKPNIEDYCLVLDLYEKLLEDLKNSSKKSEETEAFILANLVKIQFEYMNNNNYKKYKGYIKRIFFIVDKKNINKSEDWIQEINELAEKIDEKEKKPKEGNLQEIKEIEDKFNTLEEKMFILFFLDKYPYEYYMEEKDKKELLDIGRKKTDMKKLLNYLRGKYNPDKYEKKSYKNLNRNIALAITEKINLIDSKL